MTKYEVPEDRWAFIDDDAGNDPNGFGENRNKGACPITDNYLGIPADFKTYLPKVLVEWADADAEHCDRYGLTQKDFGEAEKEMEDMLKCDRKPMERRMLQLPGTKLSQGTLELWVDILSAADAAKKKLIDITMPPGEPFEMRVIIWKTKEIPAMDEWAGTSDLYVTGELEWSDANRKRQSIKVQTDTHWFVKDGGSGHHKPLEPLGHSITQSLLL
eukprot:SAG22_NODE_84_length_21617_cov_48.600102_7_plen_216_part_00